MQQPARTIRALCSLLALGLVSVLPARAATYGTPIFPCPPSLEPRVGFWVSVFSEYSNKQRVIHDAKYPWVIYEVFRVDGLTQRQIKARVESRKDYYAALLGRLAKDDPARYNKEEERVAALLQDIPAPARYKDARDRIRSQPGVKEEFQMGLRRSGRYQDAMSELLDSLGVPGEIAYLPHVESSFHPSARSKAGAVGLWQFTARTGKRFMRVERDLDERLDPIIATGAAARYLREAYSVLGSWPLAVTAYNHGVGGMARAKMQFGTKDVGRVLLNYDGPTYGFASQNFYCEFLAAMEVARNSEKYFGSLVLDPPAVTDTFRLPDHVRLPSISRAFAVSMEDLAKLNPALGPTYLRGSRPLPKGYAVRLPLGQVEDVRVQYASIPANERMAKAPAAAPSGYKVRPGDTLARIARRYHTQVDTLCKLNDLKRRDKIFPGQILTLPGDLGARL
jgi:membrane-bound lytic murein transglycosylase D